MLDKRSKGLLILHGSFVLLSLPLLFGFMAVIGVEVLHRMEYGFINFPVYILGTLIAGLLFFNFYSIMGPVVTYQQRDRVFRVTNLQISLLTLIFFGIIFATKDKSISRLFVGSFLLFSYGLCFVANLFLPGLLSRLVLGGRNQRNCLLIGSSHSVPKMQGWLKDQKHLGLNVVGLLNFGEQDVEDIGFPVLGIVSQLEFAIREHQVTQVVLLETRDSKEWVRDLLYTCEVEGCQVMIYNPWADYFEYPLVSVRDGPHTFFLLREEPLENPVNRVLKRILDLAIAIPVVCLVMPVLVPVVWFFQYRESPGPVFYKQVRRGFNKREFTIYKFRSMHYIFQPVDEGRQAEVGDERVYRFGLFMRRTSLDELPQFFNVLRGTMSVVGPRPHLPEHDELFAKEVSIYPQRHFVKPGITGLAQCKGFRGEITDVALLKQRIDYDIEYMTNWSMLMDFEIMLQTASIVFNPPDSAY